MGKMKIFNCTKNGRERQGIAEELDLSRGL